MKLNPFDLLDQLLEDWASPKARRTIHTLLLLAAALVTIWLAADGDWEQALLALAATLYAGSNKANTRVPAKYDEVPAAVEVDASAELPADLDEPGE